MESNSITILTLRYECYYQLTKVKNFMWEWIRSTLFYTNIAMCFNPKLIVRKKVVKPKVDEIISNYWERCRTIIA